MVPCAASISSLVALAPFGIDCGACGYVQAASAVAAMTSRQGMVAMAVKIFIRMDLGMSGC